MTSEPEPQELFDRWAESYDRDVAETSAFPFTGYERAHSQVVLQAEVGPGMSVLDLGTGTGKLAGALLACGGAIWATDFSTEMIRRAQASYPEIRFSVADLRDDPPSSYPVQYDRVVSAYAFHHLELKEKVELIHDLVFSRLRPAGRLLIADVSFPTALDREVARSRLSESWDSSEHYWAADETKEALRALPLDVSYSPVSFCAGVFAIDRRAVTGRSG